MKRVRRKNGGRRRRTRRRPRTKAIAGVTRYFRHKFTSIIEVSAPGSNYTVEKAAVGFAWYEKQGLITNVYGHNSSNRWAAVSANYE